MRILLSHINAKKMSIIEEILQTKIMPLWMSVSLFPQPNQSLLNGPMNRVAMMVGMQAMHSPNMSFLLPRLTWLSLTRRLICQHQRSTPSSQYGTIRGYHPATQWQVNCIGPLPLWKQQGFVLTDIDKYFGYGFVFSASSIFSNTTICGFKECLTHHPSILHSILLDQEMYLTTKIGQRWAHAWKSTGLIIYLITQKQLACLKDGMVY